jgi:hypothetical protein
MLSRRDKTGEHEVWNLRAHCKAVMTAVADVCNRRQRICHVANTLVLGCAGNAQDQERVHDELVSVTGGYSFFVWVSMASSLLHCPQARKP